MNFAFASPYFLILLILLPCFLWCREYLNIFYFPKLDWVRRENPFFRVEPWIKMLLYTLMILALSEPYIYDPSSNSHKRGRDLILAIDASGSMAESGFDPKDRFKNRYDITIELSKEFVSHRLDDNIGLVVFGIFAYSASPLTYDLEALSYLLDMTTIGLAGESTAIGDAILQSIVTLSYGKAKNRVIILLTDGYHNAGKTSPKEAVKIAKDKGIKIYTIGVGKKGSYDVALLQTIAKESGAKSYSVSSADQLQKIYQEIASLEPSPISSENFLDRYMLFYYPLAIAFGLLLFWIVWQRRSSI